jgi:membrane protein
MRAFFNEIMAIWYAERPSQLAAALAYYSMFAIAPMIFIAFALAGFFIDEMAAATQISERLAAVLGPEAVELITGAIASLSTPTRTGSSLLASIVGFFALLFAASGLFYQLKYVLNRIWRVPYSSQAGWGRLIRAQLLAFLMVLGLGLMLVVVALANVLIVWFGDLLQRLLGIESSTVIITTLASLGLLTLAFSLIYKNLPDIKIRWRDTLPGAALSAVGMALAVRLIGLYFQLTSAGTAFAAAGSVAVLMVGINYLAQIFLFGAVVTRAYASHYGSRRPDPNIEPPDEDVREPTNPAPR